MLWNCGDMLIEHKFHIVVIGADCECSSPDIWPPMMNRHYESNQLSLMGQKLLVV
jgi:hypothetical protein